MDSPEFKDCRMNEATCPLCQSKLRALQPHISSWGEYGFFQCDACGATLEICNMLEKPMTFESFAKQMRDKFYFTLREWIKDRSSFPLMPRSDGKVSVVKERPDKVKCDSCPSSFIPRSNAKSELQTRFCPDCRSNGSADAVLAEEKRAAKRSAAAKKAASTRRKKAPKIKEA